MLKHSAWDVCHMMKAKSLQQHKMDHHVSTSMIFWLLCVTPAILWNSMIKYALICEIYELIWLQILAGWAIIKNVQWHLISLMHLIHWCLIIVMFKFHENILIIYKSINRKYENMFSFNWFLAWHQLKLYDIIQQYASLSSFQKFSWQPWIMNGSYSQEVAAWLSPAFRTSHTGRFVSDTQTTI